MSGIVSGLIGGAIAVVLTAYIAKSVGKGSVPGQLKFGPFMWVVGIACLALATLPGVALFSDPDKQFWPKLALVVGFGLGAFYCIGEVAFVRGAYDQEGIEFYTPWTGQKKEKWKDLESAELNDWCSWYTLTFKSGSRIRLSRYLGGHLSALKMAEVQSEF